MSTISPRKRIWGWWFFDWASQPYNTLMLTFIFGPYFARTVTEMLVGSGMEIGAAKAQAQAYWGYGLTVSGILIAILAPILGAFADSTGRRMPWVWFFSILYVFGSAALWYTAPDQFDVTRTLILFGIGLIGMEFATIFTNSMLPTLGDRHEIGRISGSGWAFGYIGGVVALVIMLLLFQAGENGKTMLGIAPILGLDPATGADTRAVAPLTAIWYAVFMIPFFLWVRDIQDPDHIPYHFGKALKDLGSTLRGLPNHGSLLAYLGSSMFYRDALNGMYTFGGIYASGVLNWPIMKIGIFGIIAALTGALFAWIGGKADKAFGPKPVITTCILILLGTAIAIIMISPDSVFGMAVEPGSSLPDIAFFVCGGLIGAAGGAIQSASRTMMVWQSNPERMTEAFGLYALSGKATTFLAPMLIAITSDISGSQRIGIIPVAGLFLVGLILLVWVKADGDHTKWSDT
ncbi:MFS transporter [Alisedimentitalea sp. MJ-SS2]|uniref:MFS transporter n=1 Tax=Aliisedimentitalea sp. MJ-SS2 TaxID=3049795 RepID=UPI00290BB30C|nr:MFS transporter [Alisedimentitalea sp. MJ-SS2]MDU8929444.1 MFS transporter [Alisedimentitalea sp. MJ-SS2]